MSADKQEQPEIHVDEDWKSRIKAEDAALDQARQDEQTQPDEAARAKIDPSQIPSADFAVLVDMFSTQAMVSLGVIPNPATNKTEIELELAKHFIDLLGVLEDKTKGNLEERESLLLETTLHQLRLAYIEAQKAPTNKNEDCGNEDGGSMKQN